MKKILFYCQYLTGMGHLVRSRELLCELVKKFQVCFINGGPPIENFRLPEQLEVVSLPPLWIEGGKLTVTDNFSDLETVKNLRKQTLIDLFNSYQSDCLITEFFPFGRHKLLFELEPLLDHIQLVAPQTKIVCSVRDIVGRSDLAQEEEKICQLINTYFDLILLHSNPNLQTLEESFSRTYELECALRYTGFVAQPLTNSSHVEIQQPNILVSIGGGRIGYKLLDTMLDVSKLLKLSIPHTIQIFTGPFMPESQFSALQEKAINQSNVNLERYTNNLIPYMQQTDLSISLTGYNTTMNILQTGVKSLVVPIGHYSKDEEQLIRTRKLEKLGIVEVLYEEELGVESLHYKVLQCLSKPQTKVNNLSFDLQGAANSSKFLEGLLKH
jgi:predicted glycosyltransferase